MYVQLIPIDLDKEGKAIDSKLFTAAASYHEKELGGALCVGYYARVHAVVALKEEEPEYMEVFGLLGCRNTIDYPLFHVTPLTPNKDGLRLAEHARDMMVARGKSYLEDLGQRGAVVLIYVSTQGQRYWRRFLNKIGAEAANRFQLKI